MIKRQMYGRAKPDLLRKRILLADLVRAVHRHPVGVLAAGAGLRVGDDVLAAAARLAGSRVWQRLHEALLAELNAAGGAGLVAGVTGSSRMRALKGGPKPGSRLHLITEAHGIPLAV
jgi:hypothetical protein